MTPYPPPAPVYRNISHTAHFIATVLTLGCWAPLWALASWNTSRRNKKLNLMYARDMHEYNLQLERLANGPHV